MSPDIGAKSLQVLRAVVSGFVSHVVVIVLSASGSTTGLAQGIGRGARAHQHADGARHHLRLRQIVRLGDLDGRRAFDQLRFRHIIDRLAQGLAPHRQIAVLISRHARTIGDQRP